MVIDARGDDSRQPEGLPPLRDIFRDHAGFAWRVLCRFGVPEADLEDVVQDVFLVVHRRIHTFDGTSSVRTWIYAICRRVAQGHLRKAYRRREQVSVDGPEPTAPATQVESIERRRARELVATLLQGLDKEKRAVFVLFEVERMPMKEVAAALDIPLQTAYSRLNAARAAMTKAAKRSAVTGTVR